MEEWESMQKSQRMFTSPQIKSASVTVSAEMAGIWKANLKRSSLER